MPEKKPGFPVAKPIPIGEVLRKHQAEWMSVPGVAGVGIGETDGKPCIRVFVSEKAAFKRLPKETDGYLVMTEFTGDINAMGDSAD